MPQRIVVQILTRLAIAGAQAARKAMTEAIAKTAAEAARESAARAAGGATNATVDKLSALDKKAGITLSESHQILNTNPGEPLENVLKNYKHLFESNDPKKGGSFYLMSKVVNAKERIVMEFDAEENKKTAEGDETIRDGEVVEEEKNKKDATK